MKSLNLAFLIRAAVASTSFAAEKLPGPLLDGLGDLHHPVTTESKAGATLLRPGLRLLFGFNHKEAIRSFRSAAQLDPECAMAHWGVAYAYGPHVNKPMDTKRYRGSMGGVAVGGRGEIEGFGEGTGLYHCAGEALSAST